MFKYLFYLLVFLLHKKSIFNIKNIIFSKRIQVKKQLDTKNRNFKQINVIFFINLKINLSFKISIGKLAIKRCIFLFMVRLYEKFISFINKIFCL